MAGKKAAKRAVPNVSSAAGLPPSSSASKVGTSAVLHSAFSPSPLQLSLFASVIQSLDSDQLRIHDTVSGALQCEHRPQRTKITCLDWGYRGRPYGDPETSRKKRRKLDQVNGASSSHGDAVIGLGTSRSEVEVFSPAESKVIATLKDGHTRGILNFKFEDLGRSSKAWTLGGDGKLVQWDVWRRSIIRTLQAPDPSAKALLPLGHDAVLVAAQSAYLLEPETAGDAKTFLGSAGTINGLVARSDEQQVPTQFLASSDTSRYVSVFSVATEAIIGSLITERDVESIVFSQSDFFGQAPESAQSALAIVTSGGAVEVFDAPFDDWSPDKKAIHPLKKNKSRTRNSNATLSVSISGKKKLQVPVINVCFHGNEIILAVVEQSVNVCFQRVEWLNESASSLSLSGLVQLSKTPSQEIDASMVNGVKNMKHMRVDESQAQVSHGAEAAGDQEMPDRAEIIDISSGVEESSDSESADEPSVNGIAGHEKDDTEKEQVLGEREDREDAHPGKEEMDEEPSFGELMRAKEPQPIDVVASVEAPEPQALIPVGDRKLQASSGLSLGTVLSQSLRTNDVQLLENCLHMQDLHVVRATIERLDSSLATSLLQRLAERLHNRPGRAGSLMVWVQWTLIAHGGYLAVQPSVVKQLASLHKIVQERARSLQPLLALKGKLDMLEAQMNLRRSMQRRRSGHGGESEGVVYVEGQEESSSDSEEGNEDEDAESVEEEPLEGSEDNEDVDDMDDAMAVDSSDANEIESDIEGLIDDEASEADPEIDEEMEDDVDSADVDDGSDDDDDDNSGDELPRKTPLRVNGVASKHRR